MDLAGEVGLRLLLCPVSSNIVVRTACCSVGIVFPVYSTFKAIEERDQDEQQRWLIYWAAYGSFSVAEVFADKILFWFPAYYYMKFAFLVWLQCPSGNGARQLYRNGLRPFLLKHRRRLDQIVGLIYGELNKFVSSHQEEFLFARRVVMRIFASANGILSGSAHPPEGQNIAAIEGPGNQNQESESGHED
ncbi:hypothetical protein ACJRO7_034827 [Eucalyptus globulus]|uniref:HVA22-like protein n=1 Tax=Eucalyptus globulus TaxID=34317 RepID=A0ABD3J762_EUCGL